MANPSAPQYWNTGTSAWANIPDAALYTTHAGTCHVQWPAVQDRALDGTPVAAIGGKTIIMQMAWLNDTGMNFFRDLIGSASVEYSTEDFKIWDFRTQADIKLQGKLHWPTFTSVSVASTAAGTLYHGVEVRVEDCIVSAH